VSEYALSFGSVAETYERARPPYAEEAVDWIVERLPARRVLDLAAGTGKLTRQLVARGADVVAVEPDPDMRAVFRRVLPDVEMREGFAEAIPLPDASVDAITVGQAFHWFDAERALAEMRRVLRPGGGFALLWNHWDKDDPLLGAVDRLLQDVRPGFGERPVVGETRSFHEQRSMSVDAIVEWASSTSGFVNARREEQERIASEIRILAADYSGSVSIRTDVQLTDGSSGMRATSS
jgi:ubiquinone/menaquinone biosynthesis C-methylase UbiE